VFFLLLLIDLCVLLQTITRWCALLLFPPVLALFAGLTVNVLPDWRGLGCLFVGTVLLHAASWEEKKLDFHSAARRSAVRPVISLLCVLVASVCLAAVIGKTGGGLVAFIPENAEAFMDFQHNVEESLKNLDQITVRQMKTTLDNETPEYNDQIIATIRTKERPDSNLYLARYYSGTYEQSQWVDDRSAFTQAAAEAGYDADEIGQLVRQEIYQKLQLRTTAAEEACTYTVTYESIGLSDALLPYFTDLSDTGGQAWVEAEGLVQKKLGVRSITVPGVTKNSDSAGYWGLTDMGVLHTTEEQIMLRWYDQYVSEHYQNSSSEVPALDQYAHQVKLHVSATSWFYSRVSTSVAENLERVQIANQVKRELATNADYNLYLDALPDGVDPVQYFLATSHEGYCMHFASAATLILQELGVPARYATGYVVKSSAFYKDGDEYVANVRDRNGHAWVEIYLNGVGWVPYEMTPGYDSTSQSLPTESKNVARLQREHQKKLKEERQQESTAAQETETTTETQKTTGTEEATETQTAVQQVDSPVQQQAAQPRGILRRMLVLFLLVMLILGCIVGIWILRSGTRTGRKNRFRSNRRRVCGINRRLYRRLWKIATRTDAEYLQRLIDTYPAISAGEWKEFLNIAQKAAFSAEEISEEEVRFCEQVYRGLKGKR
jgi:hypothetical protein